MKQFCILDTAGFPIPGTVRGDSHSAVLAFFNVEGCKHFVNDGWAKCQKLGYRMESVHVLTDEQLSGVLTKEELAR